MEIFYQIVALLGGLSMFLYGMRVMGDGLKSNTGGAMKTVLAKVANNQFVGFLLGALITCVIQSSTATIILTVGLVGAGFLTFRQSVGIVLGANVGTAITAQIIRLIDVGNGQSSLLYLFNAKNLAPIALIIGIVLIMFSKSGNAKNIGSIAAGLGVLFSGLISMSAAVENFKEPLIKLLTAFADNYLLGFLAGVGVTGVIQSSSAVVGIIQSLASTVGVQFCGIFAVIIGVNIGDCITTFLVCRIGANKNQIRTTLVHIIYNIFAALLIVAAIVVGRTTGFIGDDLWNMTLDSGGVANLHGLFRLVPAVLLLPFAGMFATLAEKIVPDGKEKTEYAELDMESELADHLDPHLVTSPGLALDQVGILIGHIGDMAAENFKLACEQVNDFSEERNQNLRNRETVIDKMTDAANQYIVLLSPYITLESDNHYQSFLLKVLTCFERMGDLAINISQNAMSLQNHGDGFSDAANIEFDVAVAATKEILEYTKSAYDLQDENAAQKIEPLEEVIDDLSKTLQTNHVERMKQNLCKVTSGIQYQNILQNIERVSDQC
ncbi:MAG: Na/Pi cotransporter family protein, partial [Oscillospiraceae bacterium]|nr:Na/Pi cotransporter family protein [Candidatus Equicaccousia limihippi]